jgi:hypothetical protein
MPANHKISVGWQIVFTFIPIVNFWAFYRIKKLRKYLLYVVAPVIALVLFVNAFFGDLYYFLSTGRQTAWGANEYAFGQTESNATGTYVINRVQMWSPLGAITSFDGYEAVLRLAFQGFAVYLIIIWSRQHNRKFDAPPA